MERRQASEELSTFDDHKCNEQKFSQKAGKSRGDMSEGKICKREEYEMDGWRKIDLPRG